MPITITAVGHDRYTVVLTPPHGDGVPWSSTEPMGARELSRALLARGCHQTDVGDAFYEADDRWIETMDAEEDRR